MLAMLLAMTSTLSSWAIIPVAAVLSARMARLPTLYSARHVGELLDGLLVQIALRLQQRGDLLVGARDRDQAGHLDDAVHVRFLDGALHDLGRGVGRRRRIASREVVGAVLLQ